MAFEQWEFGVRPEIIEYRFVKIQGERFALDEVIDTLEAVEGTSIMDPIEILNERLVKALEAEGLVYAQGRGFVGTELVEVVLDELRPLGDADLAPHVNPALKIGYLCSVTFDHELSEIPVVVYDSPKSQKDNEGCACEDDRACNLIKVAVHALEVVE